MRRMTRVAGGILLAVAGAAAGGLAAAGVVMVLILASGGGRRPDGVSAGSMADAPVLYWQWLRGLFSDGMGHGWTGVPLVTYVAEAIKTCGFVASVLLLCLGLSAWLVWRDRTGVTTRERPGLWMAPAVFWAALVIVVVDLVVILLLGPAGISMERWLLPNGALVPRYLAAALVLAVSGGVTWDLRTGIRAEVDRVLDEDYIAVARANGLDVRWRLARNLAVPIATRVAGKLPFLLGEVIVVEYFFVLDGAGRQLVGMVEDRDAYALMTVTLLFVAVTTGVRVAVSLLDRLLFPHDGMQPTVAQLEGGEL